MDPTILQLQSPSQTPSSSQSSMSATPSPSMIGIGSGLNVGGSLGLTSEALVGSMAGSLMMNNNINNHPLSSLNSLSTPSPLSSSTTSSSSTSLFANNNNNRTTSLNNKQDSFYDSTGIGGSFFDPFLSMKTVTNSNIFATSTNDHSHSYFNNNNSYLQQNTKFQNQSTGSNQTLFNKMIGNVRGNSVVSSVMPSSTTSQTTPNKNLNNKSNALNNIQHFKNINNSNTPTKNITSNNKIPGVVGSSLSSSAPGSATKPTATNFTSAKNVWNSASKTTTMNHQNNNNNNWFQYSASGSAIKSLLNENYGGQEDSIMNHNISTSLVDQQRKLRMPIDDGTINLTNSLNNHQGHLDHPSLNLMFENNNVQTTATNANNNNDNNHNNTLMMNGTWVNSGSNSISASGSIMNWDQHMQQQQHQTQQNHYQNSHSNSTSSTPSLNNNNNNLDATTATTSTRNSSEVNNWNNVWNGGNALDPLQLQMTNNGPKQLLNNHPLNMNHNNYLNATNSDATINFQQQLSHQKILLNGPNSGDSGYHQNLMTIGNNDSTGNSLWQTWGNNNSSNNISQNDLNCSSSTLRFNNKMSDDFQRSTINKTKSLLDFYHENLKRFINENLQMLNFYMENFLKKSETHGSSMVNGSHPTMANSFEMEQIILKQILLTKPNTNEEEQLLNQFKEFSNVFYDIQEQERRLQFLEKVSIKDKIDDFKKLYTFLFSAMDNEAVLPENYSKTLLLIDDRLQQLRLETKQFFGNDATSISNENNSNEQIALPLIMLKCLKYYKKIFNMIPKEILLNLMLINQIEKNEPLADNDFDEDDDCEKQLHQSYHCFMKNLKLLTRNNSMILTNNDNSINNQQIDQTLLDQHKKDKKKKKSGKPDPVTSDIGSSIIPNASGQPKPKPKIHENLVGIKLEQSLCFPNYYPITSDSLNLDGPIMVMYNRPAVPPRRTISHITHNWAIAEAIDYETFKSGMTGTLVWERSNNDNNNYSTNITKSTSMNKLVDRLKELFPNIPTIQLTEIIRQAKYLIMKRYKVQYGFSGFKMGQIIKFISDLILENGISSNPETKPMSSLGTSSNRTSSPGCNVTKGISWSKIAAQNNKQQQQTIEQSATPSQQSSLNGGVAISPIMKPTPSSTPLSSVSTSSSTSNQVNNNGKQNSMMANHVFGTENLNMINNNNNNNDSNCALCSNKNSSNNKNVFRMPQCKHLFHKECFENITTTSTRSSVLMNNNNNNGTICPLCETSSMKNNSSTMDIAKSTISAMKYPGSKPLSFSTIAMANTPAAIGNPSTTTGQTLPVTTANNPASYKEEFPSLN